VRQYKQPRAFGDHPQAMATGVALAVRHCALGRLAVGIGASRLIAADGLGRDRCEGNGHEGLRVALPPVMPRAARPRDPKPAPSHVQGRSRPILRPARICRW
jgi:hypothetical protein